MCDIRDWKVLPRTYPVISRDIHDIGIYKKISGFNLKALL
jgi:hypothetical protein